MTDKDRVLNYWHATKPGVGLGPVENPDSTKTRTRHSDLPLEKTGLAFAKWDLIDIKTAFETGFIKNELLKTLPVSWQKIEAI